MNLITVDTAACKRDGMCSEVCPVGCIEIDAEGFPREAPDADCIACGHCVAVCPHGALANSKVVAGACRPVPKKLPSGEAVQGLLLSRRSVRAYKDRPVAAETLAGLLETARFAPTASNSQKVYWIACADPAKTRGVASLGAEWLRGSKYRNKLVDMWDQGQDVVMRGAPAFVAAYSPADYAWGAVDCSIALSYLELAAAAQGLGTCWAGLLTRAAQANPVLAGKLGIPEGHTLHGGLMLGYPKYRYRLIPPRNEAQVHWM
jgi:nitroreductase/NAD-dependent dihydropyrimidine dehydrogenase PreA subunit